MGVRQGVSFSLPTDGKHVFTVIAGLSGMVAVGEAGVPYEWFPEPHSCSIRCIPPDRTMISLSEKREATVLMNCSGQRSHTG